MIIKDLIDLIFKTGKERGFTTEQIERAYIEYIDYTDAGDVMIVFWYDDAGVLIVSVH